MQFLEDDIYQITQSIWTSILELEIQRSTQALPPHNQEDFLTASIHISGAWEGMVALHCSVELARQAATTMFRPETTTLDDIRDALGELVNMIGGNIKALLPELCELSLPVVTAGMPPEREHPDMQRLNLLSYECQGQPLLVTLLERQKTPQGV